MGAISSHKCPDVETKTSSENGQFLQVLRYNFRCHEGIFLPSYLYLCIFDDSQPLTVKLTVFCKNKFV